MHDGPVALAWQCVAVLPTHGLDTGAGSEEARKGKNAARSISKYSIPSFINFRAEKKK